MGQTIVLTGMVLSAMPVGDYDKRIQILTRERGKITAFARGARRPNSAFLAAANPFSFGQFELFEGRNAYSLAKVDIENYFRELAEDVDTAYYGFYILEMAAYYTQENMDATDFLNLLYVTLKALLKPVLDNRLVRRIYELRVLVLSGEYPNVFSCTGCGRKEALEDGTDESRVRPHFFSIRHHGVLCPDCIKGEPVIAMDASTLYAMQYIISAPLRRLYTFTLSGPVFERLEEIISKYIDHYSDHIYKSEDLLKK